MRWELHQADALTFLIDQPAERFAALVTDPPYCSGGIHKGARTIDRTNGKYVKNAGLYPEFAGENRDQYSYLRWTTLWLIEAHRCMQPSAPALIFSDWRQIPVLSSALQAAGFTWRGIVVWDKTQAGRPMLGRFRQQGEFVIWGSKGRWHDRKGPTRPGVYTFGVTAGGKKLHTTGKPLPLMEELIKVCPAGTVLDPFSGSATTGVAALRSGREFVGCEVVEAYYQRGRERLAAEVDQAGARDGRHQGRDAGRAFGGR